jgi:dihydropteroate synthase
MTVNIKGELIDLRQPKIMGILNLTPDSFYDGGKFNAVDRALAQTEKMIREGAFFVDLGACSTKPGAEEISEQEEKNRLYPILEKLIETFPKQYFSIDTFRSNVAEGCLNRGAVMINDISGGQFDPKMMETVGRHHVPYVLMHILGTPKNMQKNPQYKNIVQEILYYFSEKIEQAYNNGINDVIIDPGFGFGKTLEHNYTLLDHLDLFQSLELPILVGISRKSMICKKLAITSDDALNGTTVLNTFALCKGANILRVHDVKQAKECVDLLQALR